jgi:hypothetical protein
MAAVVLLAVKAALGLWAGLVVITASRTHHRRFLTAVVRERHTGVGVVLLVLVAATVIVLVGLATRRTWGWFGAFVLEGVGVVVALTRIGSRPGLALLSIVFSAAVVGLLLSPSARALFGRRV